MRSVSCFIALSSKATGHTRGHESPRFQEDEAIELAANDFRQSQEEKTRLPEKPNARADNILLYALRFFRAPNDSSSASAVRTWQVGRLSGLPTCWAGLLLIPQSAESRKLTVLQQLQCQASNLCCKAIH
jgi:hypothetical protein